eukprot:519461-Pelagomonas_calceolata.AAC.2
MKSSRASSSCKPHEQKLRYRPREKEGPSPSGSPHAATSPAPCASGPCALHAALQLVRCAAGRAGGQLQHAAHGTSPLSCARNQAKNRRESAPDK